jgi:hypothetical protein
MSLFLFLFHASSYEKLEWSSRWNAWTRTVRLQFYSDHRQKSLTLVSKWCRYWTCAELYLPSPHTPSWHVASLNTRKTLCLPYTWFHIKMFIYMFVNMSEYCRHSSLRDTLQQVSAKKQAVKKKVQGGSNMTGTICVKTSHSLSRSYLNHTVHAGV